MQKHCLRFKQPSFWLGWVPCITWAANYNINSLIGDVIAGLTTALTVIPQGIGYAPLAGLPLQVRKHTMFNHKLKMLKSIILI